MRESAVEKHLTRHVERRGGRCLKWTSPGRSSVPDRILLFPGGRVAFVEVKAPKKTPRQKQLRELQKLNDMGFRAAWLDSTEAVDRFIAKLEIDGWLVSHPGTFVFSDLPST